MTDNEIETGTIFSHTDRDPAPYRLEALRLAVSLAKQNATESAVFSLADQMAHWLATGERMPVAAPSQGLAYVDATPVNPGCFDCGHPVSEHRSVGCLARGPRGEESCACEFPAHAAAESKVPDPRCTLCQHAPHGEDYCAEGGRGTHRCVCPGRP